MFALPISIVSPHLSPYHPYTSSIHPASPRSPHFHLPRSPIFLGPSVAPTPTPDPTLPSQPTPRKRSAPGDQPSPAPCQRPSKRACFAHSKLARQEGVPLGSPLSTTVVTMNAEQGEIQDQEASSLPSLNRPSLAGHTAVPEFSTSVMPATRRSGRTASPPSLPPVLCMKRPNPKRLSLSLSLPVNNDVASMPTPLTATPNDSTPYTPGPPRTPALAVSTSLGRASTKGMRRPSLLSLITQPTNNDDVPPTPGGASFYTPFGSSRGLSLGPIEVKDGRHGQPSFTAISEHDTLVPTLGPSYQYATSPSTSGTSSTSSSTPSSFTTPASSPPQTSGYTTLIYPSRSADPYAQGPIEIIPNVFLGAEESAVDLTWAKRYTALRILNVAQEIESPYAVDARDNGKVAMSHHSSRHGPEVDYCHLRWSHGEGGLADLVPGASIRELIEGPNADLDAESWGFWNAIRWLEEARRSKVPVLIHCQCGISRSATLAVAYLMCLAVAGLEPEHLGHLKGMQDTYDFVKAKSPCIGPNVSLVFQLVEFQRNLTSLLSLHVADGSNSPITTSFPTLAQQELTEAEWARRRKEFEDSESEDERSIGLASPISPEEAGDEARRLDEAMVQRLRERV